MGWVKLLVGKDYGVRRWLPPHAEENQTSQGMAVSLDSDGNEVPFPHQVMRNDSAFVVPVESDAAGEVVVPPHAEAAKPKDEIATHATDGRPAEPRRAAPVEKVSQHRPVLHGAKHAPRGRR